MLYGKYFQHFIIFALLENLVKLKKSFPLTIKLFVNKNKTIKDFLEFKSQTNLSLKQNKIGELQLLLC